MQSTADFFVWAGLTGGPWSITWFCFSSDFLFLAFLKAFFFFFSEVLKQIPNYFSCFFRANPPLAVGIEIPQPVPGWMHELLSVFDVTWH